MTDSPDGAAVQYLAIYAMGGKDMAKSDYRPATVREAVTRVVDATFRSHNMVADRVNMLLTCIETMHKVEVPFHVKVVKDGHKVLAMLLATNEVKTKPVPKPIDFGSAPVKEKAEVKGWDQLLSWATSAQC
jgi:hypothetical protein